MQRIVKLVWSAEQYAQKGLERTIGRPAHCPNCARTQGFEAHGYYRRWVSGMEEVGSRHNVAAQKPTPIFDPVVFFNHQLERSVTAVCRFNLYGHQLGLAPPPFDLQTPLQHAQRNPTALAKLTLR
jgi:hypothetical protein